MGWRAIPVLLFSECVQRLPRILWISWLAGYWRISLSVKPAFRS